MNGQRQTPTFKELSRQDFRSRKILRIQLISAIHNSDILGVLRYCELWAAVCTPESGVRKWYCPLCLQYRSGDWRTSTCFFWSQINDTTFCLSSDSPALKGVFSSGQPYGTIRYRSNHLSLPNLYYHQGHASPKRGRRPYLIQGNLGGIWMFQPLPFHFALYEKKTKGHERRASYWTAPHKAKYRP